MKVTFATAAFLNFAASALAVAVAAPPYAKLHWLGGRDYGSTSKCLTKTVTTTSTRYTQTYTTTTTKVATTVTIPTTITKPTTTTETVTTPTTTTTTVIQPTTTTETVTTPTTTTTTTTFIQPTTTTETVTTPTTTTTTTTVIQPTTTTEISVTITTTTATSVTVTTTTATTSVPACPTGNVIANGGFESPLAGNWMPLISGDGTIERFSAGTGANDGTFVFRSRVTSTLTQRLVQAVTICPNKPLTISFVYRKASSAAATQGINIWVGGTQVGQVLAQATAWTPFTATVTPPAGANSVMVMFEFTFGSNSATKETWIDSVVLS